jgi:hypothetical protein
MTYTQWKAANGVSSDALDIDQDGLLPLLEYAEGGSPTTNDVWRNPQVRLANVVAAPAGKYLLVSAHLRRGADDLIAGLEASQDLHFWSGADADLLSTEALPDGTDLLTWKINPSTNTVPFAFIRVRWERVP